MPQRIAGAAAGNQVGQQESAPHELGDHAAD
jgi:hypothetical protein